MLNLKLQSLCVKNSGQIIKNAKLIIDDLRINSNSHGKSTNGSTSNLSEKISQRMKKNGDYNSFEGKTDETREQIVNDSILKIKILESIVRGKLSKH